MTRDASGEKPPPVSARTAGFAGTAPEAGDRFPGDGIAGGSSGGASGAEAGAVRLRSRPSNENASSPAGAVGNAGAAEVAGPPGSTGPPGSAGAPADAGPPGKTGRPVSNVAAFGVCSWPAVSRK